MSIKVPAPKPLAPELFAPKKNWWGSTKVSTGHKQSLKTAKINLKTQKNAYKKDIKNIRDKIEKKSTDKIAQKRSGIIKANALRMESLNNQKDILTKARSAGTITPEKYDEKIAKLLNYVSRQSVSTYRKRDIIAKYIPGINWVRSYAKSDLYKKSLTPSSSTNTPENKLTNFQTFYNKKVANETQKSIDAQIKSITNIQAFGNTYAKADYGSKSGMKTYKNSLALAKKTATNSVYKAHKSYGLSTQNSKTINNVKNAVITRMLEQQKIGAEKEAVYEGANKWKLGWWNPLQILPKTYIKKSTDKATLNTKKNAQNIQELYTLSRDVNIADTKVELLTKLHKNTSDKTRKNARNNAVKASTNAKTAYDTRLENITKKLIAPLIKLPQLAQAPAQAQAPSQQPDATAAIIKPFGTNKESALRNLQIEQITLQKQRLKQNITLEESNTLQKKIAEVGTKIIALNTQKLSLHQPLQTAQIVNAQTNPNASTLPIKKIINNSATRTVKQRKFDNLTAQYNQTMQILNNAINAIETSKNKDDFNKNKSQIASLEKERKTTQQEYNSALRKHLIMLILQKAHQTSNTSNPKNTPPRTLDRFFVSNADFPKPYTQ